ncbi:hypothetical protein IWX90DRAFT_324026 [Phyllosticta citrichinensis]|uniref:Formylmethionine deformylase-like protein n=1 Tax=Phyllosticta citrichinensis TaxID=1130410 RepID=A0ABR1XK46_9PEZI
MDPHGFGHELQQKSTPRGVEQFKSRDDDFQRVPHISSGASHSSLLHYDSDAQKTGRPGPQVTATDLESIPKIASWNIHWRSPALMAGFFLAGVWFALGHHFHYQALEDQEVGSATRQQWAIRIGTLLAFLSKACLAGAVGVAYTQRLWVTVKEKPISLRNLDNVFSLTTSPVSFFSLEVLTSAKVLCLLAACMWCIPIAATITPATLSVRTVMLPNSTTARVPLPDFLNEDAWANFEGVGRPSSSTASVNRILAATSSSMSTLSFTAPFTNSSYTVDFYGPAMKCEDLATASAESLDLGEAKSLQEAFQKTLNVSEFSPGLSVLYAAGSPDSVEGVLMQNHLFVHVPNSDTQNLSCHLWNTSYQVLFRFDDGVQSTIIQNLTHVAPTDIQGDEIMTEYAPGEIAYWSMFSALSRVLTTTLGFGSTMYLNGADSTFIQTGVAACPQISNVSGYSLAQYSSPWMCRNGSVDKAIEDLSHNFTLSLLSTDLFSNMTDAPITVVSSKVHYEYNRTDLLIAYAAAVGVALVCISVGASAYFANGYSASTSFSSIISTTRNADLDRLVQGACLGAQPLPRRMGDMKLRFGVLRSDDSVPHAAFGLQEDVAKLRKGDTCS